MRLDTSIISRTVGISPEWAANYILQRPHGEYNEHDIRNVIVPTYFSLGKLLGIDPLYALAQAVHETGNFTSWWSARPRRNPAGIGVTGAWKLLRPHAGEWARKGPIWLEGVSFASWEHDGIPAHLGRLLAYALPVGAGDATQQEYIRRALLIRTLPASYRGIAKTWRDLGGRWATSTTYAERIIKTARAMAL